MQIFSVAAVVLINVFIAVRYTVQIRRGAIRPALAMWIFFSVAVAGSLGTYLAGGTYTPLDNILNVADLFLCVYVAIIIAVLGDASPALGLSRLHNNLMVVVFPAPFRPRNP